MEHERFVLKIEGEEVADLYPDLAGLEVELDHQMAAMFRLGIAVGQEEAGSWTLLDDENLRPWRKVEIEAGFESATEALITGYITHVRPRFDPDPAAAFLEIWGLDESVLMDREEKLKDWPNKKDSDIAREIFQPYGFDTSGVEDTEVIHDEAVSTIIQRETDVRFLNRLALRNGFECYVENGQAFFRPPQVDAQPQPVLAVHFGDETNVTHFSVEVNALRPANVAMTQVDRVNKEVLEATAEETQFPALGESGAGDLLAAGMSPGRVQIAMNSTTGAAEMENLCRGLFHQGDWFVTAQGEINGSLYGHVLKPRGTVTIKGVSETHSGVYYVSRVTHRFTPDGYSQIFAARRNGLMPTGQEDFSGSSG